SRAHAPARARGAYRRGRDHVEPPPLPWRSRRERARRPRRSAGGSCAWFAFLGQPRAAADKRHGISSARRRIARAPGPHGLSPRGDSRGKSDAAQAPGKRRAASEYGALVRAGPLGAIRALGAFHPLDALDALGPLGALGPFRTLGALRPIVPAAAVAAGTRVGAAVVVARPVVVAAHAAVGAELDAHALAGRVDAADLDAREPEGGELLRELRALLGRETGEVHVLDARA